MEQVADLLADELDQAVLIQLGGERLRDAVDGGEFGSALADFVLPFVDQR